MKNLLLLALLVLVGCSSGAPGPVTSNTLTRSEFKAKMAEIGLKGKGDKVTAEEFYKTFGDPANKISEDPGWDSGQYTFIYHCSDGDLFFEAYEGPAGDGDSTEEVHFFAWVSQ